MKDFQPPLQDNEAFSNLFSRTQLIIFRFIYGLLGGPLEEVEDLTIDTYFKAWKGRNRFSGSDHDALCWLFTIARHLVIDAIRKRKTHMDGALLRLDDEILEGIVSNSQISPEEQAEFNDLYVHLWRSMQSLQYHRREMLILRYVIGWQVKEIAEYLQMEENTVTVYIHRSLDQIRRNWIES